QQEEAESPLVPRPKLRPRVGPSNNPPQVLFTGLVAAPALLVALGTLGGSVATDVTGCSHLVTDRVRRTVKFLCGVARGIPIVTPQWLLQAMGVWGQKREFRGHGGRGDNGGALGDRRALGDMGQRPWGQGTKALGTREVALGTRWLLGTWGGGLGDMTVLGEKDGALGDMGCGLGDRGVFGNNGVGHGTRWLLGDRG
ncbi:MDC1 protein, partial [Caloenas nicobarica]|nr:MDC1 protein [Caloenas nicobarica]